MEYNFNQRKQEKVKTKFHDILRKENEMLVQLSLWETVSLKKTEKWFLIPIIA